MDKKLKKNLLISGLIGLGLGILYFIGFFTLPDIYSKINLGLLYWILTPILFFLTIPFFVTAIIFGLFGYVTVGYMGYGMIFSLILYFFAGVGVYYAYYHFIIKRK